MVDYSEKIDQMKKRLMDEYASNGVSEEEKAMMKKVIEIGARITHTALSDISEVPELRISIEKITDRMEEIINRVNILFDKFDEYLGHREFNEVCRLQVETMIRESNKERKVEQQKDFRFFYDTVKFIIFVVAIGGGIYVNNLWVQKTLESALMIKGG